MVNAHTLEGNFEGMAFQGETVESVFYLYCAFDTLSYDNDSVDRGSRYYNDSYDPLLKGRLGTLVFLNYDSISRIMSHCLLVDQ